MVERFNLALGKTMYLNKLNILLFNTIWVAKKTSWFRINFEVSWW
jgi:hypothetical protein